MVFLESSYFTSKHLILRLLKLTVSGAASSHGFSETLSEDNRGNILLSRDFFRVMQYNRSLVLVIYRNILHT